MFRCGQCYFHFYQNSSPSVAVVIPSSEQQSSVLLVTRSIEPGKGLLALPGGFLNYAEAPRDAAVRETTEETGFAIEIISLISINHVEYSYQGTHRAVLEHAFLASSVEPYVRSQSFSTETAAIEFYGQKTNLSQEDFAFPCHFDVLQRYARSIPET